MYHKEENIEQLNKYAYTAAGGIWKKLVSKWKRQSQHLAATSKTTSIKRILYTQRKCNESQNRDLWSKETYESIPCIKFDVIKVRIDDVFFNQEQDLRDDLSQRSQSFQCYSVFSSWTLGVGRDSPTLPFRSLPKTFTWTFRDLSLFPLPYLLRWSNLSLRKLSKILIIRRHL